MGGLTTYILSVVAGAILCGCITQLAGKNGTAATVIRSLCGLYMLLLLLSPIRNMNISDYTKYFENIFTEADAVSKEGEALAGEELTAFIKEKTEAYVLEKAVSLGADLSVEITLGKEDIPAPVSITVKGAVSPYVKKVLTRYIAEQLGIPEEAQHWT